MAPISFDSAEVSGDPFPHLVLDDALPPAAFQAILRALPPQDGFAVKGRGLKLELDVVESSPQLTSLAPEQQAQLIELRELIRTSAPGLVARFEAALRKKYVWLLGDALAETVLSTGWTTSNGRVMGRAPGYQLGPHLDSSHFGITCLLYFSDARTEDEGALGLYRPDREPEVLDASTYYPEKAEGITSTLVRSIAVRQNRFVAFVNTPVSLHGFHRTSDASGWRMVYQCHVFPAGLRIDDLIPLLDESRRQRWHRYQT